MPNLYAGNILKVDLSSGEITMERTSVYADAFLGGRGINIKLLYDNISQGTDALASGNVLVFGVGPLGGTSLSTGRTEVTAKSPETGLLASSNFGGSFGGELKYAGYDHLVVTGKAEKPVYILINNDTIEIKDASGVWGKDAYETQDHLRREVGNPEVKIACIGPAGENLVRFSTIQHGLGHGAGRTGTGAVMGSKNLKAIVVRGTGGLKIADPVKFLAHAGELKSEILEHPGLKAFSEEGMSRVQDGDPEEVEERWGIPMPSDHDIYERFKPKRAGCLGCPVQCMDFYQVKELGKGGSGVISCHLYSEWTKNPRCFDTAASLECGVLSQRYGIDCISTAQTIRWLMELYEKGIITAKDTDGIVMEWGSPEAMRSMLDKITFREGIGDVLADGILHAAEKIGRGSIEYANQVKGIPFDNELTPEWMPLLRAGALAHIAGARGESVKSLPGELELMMAEDPEAGEWRMAMLDEYAKYIDMDIDAKKAVAAGETEGKAALLAHEEDLSTIADILSTCKMQTASWLGPYVPEWQAKVLSAGLGVETSPEDLFKYAIKARSLERAYEAMEGLTRDIEKFPKRFHRPIESGPNKGAVLESETLEKMKDDYYALRGWDVATGTPTEETLKTLGLEDVAGDMQKQVKQEEI
ncbi:MAG: aldehyde ferredoxin oxidoreductase family protein [Gammaproteobacteria bacterium]|nr:aldehyde ferredoxin oxidoreductase family protein [Gammaproteobacteria bacterium]